MSAPEEVELALPLVQSSLLDEDTVSALFRDIAAAGELLGVQVKGSTDSHAEPERPSLTRARELLSAGGVRGVQLRYRVDGVAWCDTLMRTPEGVRLVRMEIPVG